MPRKKIKQNQSIEAEDATSESRSESLESSLTDLAIRSSNPKTAVKPRNAPEDSSEEAGLAESSQTPADDVSGSDSIAPETSPQEPELSPKKVIEFIKSKIRRTHKRPALDARLPSFDQLQDQTLDNSEKPKRKNANQKSEPEAPKTVEEAQEHEEFIIEDDLLVLSWRPRQLVAPNQTALEPAISEPAAPRKARRNRRKEGQAAEITAAAALTTEEKLEKTPKSTKRIKTAPEVQIKKKEDEPKVEAPKKPSPLSPARPPIPIPAEAPQIVLKDGVPVLTRNGRIYPPISFFGSSPDEKRSRTTLEQVKMAADAGIQIFSHLVELDVDPRSIGHSVSLAAFLLAKTVEIAPDAQVVFRVVFTSPPNWQDQYPNAKWMMPSGKLAEPSVCDDVYWGVAKQCLTDFIKALRDLPFRDNILGVHLERGEWFFAEGSGYDNSRAACAAFRRWAEVRYIGDEVALRAAWFDGSAQFWTLSIPEYKDSSHIRDKFVRSSRKERRWVDYHLFLSDWAVFRIADLAYTVKEASKGMFLAGVSYGYTFEWSHPASGHLSLGKLLRTPEVDFIAGPPSYRSREPGGSAPFPCPIDSFALNGKLYISEEDYKTSIGEGYDPDDFNPVIKTPQALESVHWRGAGAALAHCAGVSWMDLWGNGWLRTANIWSRAKKVKDLLTLRFAAPQTEPEVAVFIDERALAYLVDESAFQLLVQNLREAVLRAGLSAGFYLLSDLAHREQFPESKLYIFLNAWDIRSELRAAIKAKLQRDNKVLFWLYAAGQFDSGRDSLERAREVTGIALKPQPFHSKTGTTLLNRRHILCEAFDEQTIIGGSQLEPSYFGIPEDATVLGEYSQSGLSSFLIKEFRYADRPENNWTSVFLGEPVVTPAFVRALGQLAGCHIWNHQEDVVHVRPPFLLVHCKGTGPRTVTLPNKWAAFNAIANEWVSTDASNVRFNAIDGSSHLFLVGPMSEIEHVLSQDREELLKMKEIVKHAEPQPRFDADAFDVPIVKLDEWMEGGVVEEITEEWLFKPSLLEEPPVEPAELTISRPRKKRRSKTSGNETTADQLKSNKTEEAFDDFGMNVVFRKRE